MTRHQPTQHTSGPPLYLVEPVALQGLSPGEQFRLDGDEGHHAATVRRTRVGERVDVADGAGRLARCTMLAADPTPRRGAALTLRIEAIEEEPPPAVRLVLVQALAKGGRDELAVETATELGVDELVPWRAARSVADWSPRAAQRWVATVRAAAKQSRRARVPAVTEALDTTRLLDRVGAVTGAGGAAYVLDGAAPLALAALPGPEGAGEVMIVVGPEGGISPEELDRLVGAGARAARLGPHTLRASSAGPAALAVLQTRLGLWG